MVATSLLTAIDALRRHNLRRRQGIPTVSVFVGQSENALALWRTAIRTGPAAPLVVHGPALASLISNWLSRVDQHGELVAGLTRYLTRAAAPGKRIPDGVFRDKSAHEMTLALDRLLPDEPPPHTAWLVRELLRWQVATADDKPLLRRVSEAYSGPGIHLVIAACDLLAPTAAPELFVTRGTAIEDDHWLATAAESLVQLATAVPALPLAISIDGPAIDGYLAAFRTTRTGTTIREGLIVLDHRVMPQDAAACRFTAGKEDEAGSAFESGDPNSESLADTSGAAMSVPPSPRTREEDDQARSAAERFLFEQLRAFPGTTGLFTLNEVVAADGFHGQRAEIDLCSSALRIAIEIDGYYHFGEPEAYRRDRKKDWALQHEGYVVLRFLADDVMEHVGPVLERIASTVRRQRTFLPSRGM
jgi:hypothetical protein